MQPTDSGSASANPSWVAVDMGALIHQCDAELAQHDAMLDRLTSGVAALEAEKQSVQSARQQAVLTREEALRVQEMLHAAARAGAALRSGQRDGGSSFKDVPAPDERNGHDACVADLAAGSSDAEATPADKGSHTDKSSTAFDASKLGPHGLRAMQIINSEPTLQWTGKLLAIRLEGPEAEADGRAHNRARTLMGYLAKKQLVVKTYSDDGRRCYFVAASATEAT